MTRIPYVPHRMPGIAGRLAAACLFGVALTGCAVVPGFNLPLSRQVESATMKRLQVGRTTRVDVLMMLGDPDRRLLEDRAFGYQWEELIVAMGWGRMLERGVSLTRKKVLLIEFDSNGRMRRMDVVAAVASDALNVAVQEWLAGASLP